MLHYAHKVRSCVYFKCLISKRNLLFSAIFSYTSYTSLNGKKANIVILITIFKNLRSIVRNRKTKTFNFFQLNTKTNNGYLPISDKCLRITSIIDIKYKIMFWKMLIILNYLFNLKMLCLKLFFNT